MRRRKDAIRVRCFNCGSHNDAAREFCVACVEPLQGALPVGGVAANRQGLPERRRWSVPWRPLAVAIAVVGASAYYLPRARSSPPAAKVDVGVFVIPAREVAPAQPQPRPSSASEQARRLLAKGQREEALALLERAVADAPQDGEAHLALATLLWEMGQQERALVEAAAAARLDGRFHPALARMLSHAGRHHDAATAYEAALAAKPDDPDLWREAGLSYGEAGAPRQAVVAMRRAAELRPNDSQAFRGLGWALEKDGDVAEAIGAYRRAVDLDQRSADARGRLTELLLQGGRHDEAVEVYRKAIQPERHEPSLHRELGSLLERMGRTKDAVLAYREYARLAPAAPDSRGVLRRAEALDANQAGGS